MNEESEDLSEPCFFMSLFSVNIYIFLSNIQSYIINILDNQL